MLEVFISNYALEDKNLFSFNEAQAVFYDFLSITIFDVAHSTYEERFITIGKSVLNRILVVIHTDKSDVIRIISSRIATKNERKKYKEEK